jgi:2-polyprenyl-3-methyl-5-hydroxy-6-metoxy-1,4-benzoquinol methylase
MWRPTEDAMPNAQNEIVLDQFTKQAEAYAALVRANPSGTLAALLDAARPRPDERVLDVGCGAGGLALALASICREVVGVDLTPAMLDQARAAQAARGVTNVAWETADVTALPFPDASFSLVTSTAMLHHTADPAAVVAEMRRVCAPGGRIAVADLTPAPEKGAAFDAIEILRDPSHTHAMPPAELRGLGERLGLVERSVRAVDANFPLESVLATSFPDAGVLDKVRALYAADAASGADALGLSARTAGGRLMVTYPMTLVVWTIA